MHFQAILPADAPDFAAHIWWSYKQRNRLFSQWRIQLFKRYQRSIYNQQKVTSLQKIGARGNVSPPTSLQRNRRSSNNIYHVSISIIVNASLCALRDKYLSTEVLAKIAIVAMNCGNIFNFESYVKHLDRYISVP